MSQALDSKELPGTMTHFDIIGIGSGISNLCAGILLARKGLKVAILESHLKPGGYLHCFSRFGLLFDTGAHYLGSLNPGEPFSLILKYLGIDPSQHFRLLDSAAFDELHFPWGTIKVPSSYDLWEQDLCEIFPKEKKGIKGFLSDCRKAASAFPTYRFNLSTSSDVLASLDKSLKEVVELHTQNSELQIVFCAYCTLHAVSPEDTPFGFHAILIDTLMNGASGFLGGGDSLAAALVAEFRKAGGTLKLRSRVTQINFNDAQTKAEISTNKESYSADLVIGGIHPRLLFSLIKKVSSKPAFEKRLFNMKESIGFLGLYAEANPDELGFKIDRNYFAIDVKSLSQFEFAKNNEQLKLGDFPALYLARNMRWHEPPSSQLTALTIHAPGPHQWFEKFKDERWGRRGQDYKNLKKHLAEKLIEKVELTWPGTAAAIKNYELSTPLSNIHFNPSFQGSPYGVYHSIDNTGARALGPRTHIRNLLLTGQNTLFPGIMSAAVSGLRTAGHILGTKPIISDLIDLQKELGF